MSSFAIGSFRNGSLANEISELPSRAQQWLSGVSCNCNPVTRVDVEITLAKWSVVPAETNGESGRQYFREGKVFHSYVISAADMSVCDHWFEEERREIEEFVEDGTKPLGILVCLRPTTRQEGLLSVIFQRKIKQVTVGIGSADIDRALEELMEVDQRAYKKYKHQNSAI